MSRGGPRRHFTLTINPELAKQVANYMSSHGFTSESAAVNALLNTALAATPEHGAISGDRARAYNEVRKWSMERTVEAHRHIAQLLEASKDS